MKTRASLSGTPIHPMLVHYPIALWTTAVITDVIFYFQRNLSLLLISKFLIAAGIVGAVAAAVPGLIDWLTIRDPATRKTGTLHLILNISALILFSISLYLRMRNYGAEMVSYGLKVPFLISFVGWVDMAIAANFGGKLVYHHRMGIDEGPPPV